MNESIEPTVITLPLSFYKNMQIELAWRNDHLKAQFKEIRDILEKLKERLSSDDFQTTSPPFDPFKTIGKYQ